MNISKKIILLPAVIIVLLGGAGLMVIDEEIREGLGVRVERELKWLAESALEGLAISNKTLTVANVDAIAKRFGNISGARITFVDEFGVVTGDSKVAIEAISTLPNHKERIEIFQAYKSGLGVAKRHSETLKQDFFYVAIFKPITVQGQSIDYYARASFSSLTIRKQIVHMRYALLSILTVGVIFITLLTVLVLRWLSLSNEREKLHLENELRSRDTEIELMHELDSLLSACSEIADAKEVIKQVLPSILTQSQGAISVYKSSRDKLKTQMYWGGTWSENKHFRPNQCWGLRKGHRHLSSDKQQGVVCEHFANTGNQSTLCIPLIAHGETIGVLHLLKSKIDSQTAKLADAIAKRIGIAIANIELRFSLREQAIKDTLTNLYNRRYLFESLEQFVARALRTKSHIGIVMVDIDNFKKLNDSHGHDAGDLALKAIAKFFKTVTRASDVVCRYGGEEFCIVCPESNSEETLFIAEKLCFGVRDLAIQISGTQKITLTLSAGVAIFPNAEESIQKTISDADQALYQAKHDGRNCVRVSQSIHS
ncbi:MAG: diguanylate cyclase [Pseudomonadales bacterium]|nr:diguanylate cyclase [Pseudomonadales bacterium]NRA17962.1 diguanylate cyclase [Oceanospirillaceae bacterium]